MTILPQIPDCWDHRCGPPHLFPLATVEKPRLLANPEALEADVVEHPCNSNSEKNQELCEPVVSPLTLAGLTLSLSLHPQ